MKIIKATIHGIVTSHKGVLLEITEKGTVVTDEVAKELKTIFENHISIEDLEKIPSSPVEAISEKTEEVIAPEIITTEATPENTITEFIVPKVTVTEKVLTDVPLTDTSHDSNIV